MRKEGYMNTQTMMRGAVCWTLAVLFLMQSIGCGTMFYPERRGQKFGRIDAGVAVMDAAWLIVFIIPGVIAFAVDYSTGCIYLPGGQKTELEDGGVKVMRMDPAQMDDESVREAVIRETGIPATTDFTMADVYVMDGKGFRAMLAGAEAPGSKPWRFM